MLYFKYVEVEVLWKTSETLYKPISEDSYESLSLKGWRVGSADKSGNDFSIYINSLQKRDVDRIEEFDRKLLLEINKKWI